MQGEFRKLAKLLLRKASQERVFMTYGGHSWPMPRISLRPPYYTNPRYEPRYPLL